MDLGIAGAVMQIPVGLASVYSGNFGVAIVQTYGAGEVALKKKEF